MSETIEYYEKNAQDFAGSTADIEFSELQDTFCTRLCENETNIKVIQSIMGHSDIQTTLDIYAECTAEKKQEVMESLEGKIIIR